MPRRSKHIIPPKLERQLDRIELIGNAEAELAAQEEKHPLEIYGSKPEGKLSNSERQHRLDTARSQFLREANRTKKLGFILLALVPVTCLTYVASILLENSMLGLISMLLSGLLISFGVVVILMSNRNIKDISSFEEK